MQPPAERGEDGFRLLAPVTTGEVATSQSRHRLRAPAIAVAPLGYSDVRVGPEAAWKVRRDLGRAIDGRQPLDLPDPPHDSAVQHPHAEAPRIDFDALSVPSVAAQTHARRPAQPPSAALRRSPQMRRSPRRRTPVGPGEADLRR